MTQNTKYTPGPIDPRIQRPAPTQSPKGQPVFFYDGEFRTLGQMEKRARLNIAITEQLLRRPLSDLFQR